MKYLLTIFLYLNGSLLLAQHDHGHMPVTPTKDTSAHVLRDTMPKDQHHGHTGEHAVQNNMSHSFSRNLPMTRNGSGTAWLPDESPMFGLMFHDKEWMFMMHGDLFLRYNRQDLFNAGERGDAKLDAPNMMMFMGQRDVGERGLFRFSSMISLDPLTVGGEGYPLLFQTGETYMGKPLVDRQHPHDLISELSIGYSHAFSKQSDLFIYVGYPGEPALGPSAFVHRPSAFMNPDAPLTHHWVDATHITFGVATLGFRHGNLKAEFSSFTGREPGENRYNFDTPRFDSWSGRLSYNPGPRWALQVSHGFLREPESIHPGEDVNRTTASASYSAKKGTHTFQNITGIWGVNRSGGHHSTHGLLLEGSHIQNKASVYARYEWVQKSREELDLDSWFYGHDEIFPVQSLTAGFAWEIFNIGPLRASLGTHVTVSEPSRRLRPLYGSMPLSGEIYLRIFPPLMNVNR